MKILLKILYVIIIVVSVAFIVMIYNDNKNLIIENEEIYKKFEENNLIDVSGNVNLNVIKANLEEEKNATTKLFKDDNITLEKASELIDIKSRENEEIQTSIEQLTTKKEDLTTKVDSLTKQYEQLKKQQTYKQTQNSTSKVLTHYIENVATINQYPNYYSGCEAVALTILLKYYNVNVSPLDIISNIKTGSYPYYENDVMYGGNPELEYVGNPKTEKGYGVYENPIADVAEIYKSGIIRKNNFEFSEVLKIVKSNRPVMVWTSMDLLLPYISKSWIYKPTGETISWKANEHAVVVIGYNDNYVVISDPIGGEIKYQSRSVFEQRYNYYGKKALFYI